MQTVHDTTKLDQCLVPTTDTAPEVTLRGTFFAQSDSWIDTVGIRPESINDIFESLFWTHEPSDYTRENGSGQYAKIYGRQWTTKTVYQFAAGDTAKNESGVKRHGSYKGPYDYHVNLSAALRPDTLRMIVIDVDNPELVPFLKSTFANKPNVIWTRSRTKGKFHIHILINETSFGDCDDFIGAWRRANGLEKGIETNTDTLKGVRLPGQTDRSRVCEPGDWDQPFDYTYKQTKKLFADVWSYHRASLEETFGTTLQELEQSCTPQNLLSEATLTNKSMHVHTGMRQSDSFNLTALYEHNSETTTTTLNGNFTTTCLMNSGKQSRQCRTDIPVVNRSMGCTVDGKRHDFHSIDDCQNEGDGFLISCSFLPALLRHFKGDAHQAIEAAIKHRQSMRVDSKKDDAGLLRTHVQSDMKYWSRTYDPSMTKSDPQQVLDDKTALIDFYLRDKRQLVKNCQTTFKQHRGEVVEVFGKSVYSAAIETIPYAIRDIDRRNGRIARHTDKNKNEYTYADSCAWIDYPPICGKERLKRKVVQALIQFGILTDLDKDGNKTYDHTRQLCTRWNVCQNILNKTDKRIKPVKGSLSDRKNEILPANIAVHTPNPHHDDSDHYDGNCPYSMYAKDIPANLPTFEEMCLTIDWTDTP